MLDVGLYYIPVPLQHGHSNDLLPDGTKSLPQPVLTHSQLHKQEHI